MKELKVPVSVGELVDKISILRIKARRIRQEEKLVHINKELSLLCEICDQEGISLSHPLSAKLEQINESLWNIEDRIRNKDRIKEFDDEFIALARSVYRTNDERFAIKLLINQEFNSGIQEEKSYQKYDS